MAPLTFNYHYTTTIEAGYSTRIAYEALDFEGPFAMLPHNYTVGMKPRRPWGLGLGLGNGLGLRIGAIKLPCHK